MLKNEQISRDQKSIFFAIKKRTEHNKPLNPRISVNMLCNASSLLTSDSIVDQDPSEPQTQRKSTSAQMPNNQFVSKQITQTETLHFNKNLIRKRKKGRYRKEMVKSVCIDEQKLYQSRKAKRNYSFKKDLLGSQQQHNCYGLELSQENMLKYTQQQYRQNLCQQSFEQNYPIQIRPQSHQFIQKIPQSPKLLTNSQYFKKCVQIQTLKFMDKSKRKMKGRNYHKPNINDFIIIKQLGNGAYSKIFLVYHQKIHMLFALKVMDKQFVKKLNIIENIIWELKILTFANHSNIMKSWGFFDDQQFLYIISEFCTDGQLYKLMLQYQRNHQIINRYQSISFLKQIFQAINYLHELSIMHRDIKPENILLSFGNNIKICDFGWSIKTNPHKFDPRNTLCGTPLYLAPEIISRNTYTKSIDIWALGIMTYQLLTGNIPFEINQAEDLTRIVYQEVSYDILSHDPEAIAFISLLLNKNAERRICIKDILQHPFLAQRHNPYTFF